MLEFFSKFVIENINELKFLLENNFYIFTSLYILITCTLLILPIPATTILVFSGILFKEKSYIINYIILNISCSITYSVFNYLSSKKYTNIKFIEKYIKSHKSEISSISTILNFILGRIFIPFSIFSYSSGYLKLSFKKYIIGNLIGVIPRSVIITSIGLGLSSVQIYKKNIFFQFLSNRNTLIAIYTILLLYFFKVLFQYFNSSKKLNN